MKRHRVVSSFHGLLTPFTREVNAWCCSRTLEGDFAAIAARLAPRADDVGGVLEVEAELLRVALQRRPVEGRLVREERVVEGPEARVAALRVDLHRGLRGELRVLMDPKREARVKIRRALLDIADAMAVVLADVEPSNGSSAEPDSAVMPVAPMVVPPPPGPQKAMPTRADVRRVMARHGFLARGKER
jgi:hypothetical protein